MFVLRYCDLFATIPVYFRRPRRRPGDKEEGIISLSDRTVFVLDLFGLRITGGEIGAGTAVFAGRHSGFLFEDI